MDSMGENRRNSLGMHHLAYFMREGVCQPDIFNKSMQLEMRTKL